MLSLILAICSSAAISLIMRLSESRSKSSLGMLAMNYIVCTLLAATSDLPAQKLLSADDSSFCLSLGLFPQPPTT